MTIGGGPALRDAQPWSCMAPRTGVAPTCAGAWCAETRARNLNQPVERPASFDPDLLFNSLDEDQNGQIDKVEMRKFWQARARSREMHRSRR